jgi:hypothetical protein
MLIKYKPQLVLETFFGAMDILATTKRKSYGY